MRKRGLARRSRRTSARTIRLNASTPRIDGLELSRWFSSADPPVLKLAEFVPEQPKPACVGVRVGRLPPRGSVASSPPRELAELARPAPSARPETLPAARRHAPFRPETWQKVERAAGELGLGELTLDQRRLIRAALEGSDSLATLPAGLARAACYLVVARLATAPVLVVSARPHLLRELGDRLLVRRVPTLRIDRSTPEGELARALERIRAGGSLVVLATAGMLLGEALPKALEKSGIALAVVDEAHVAAPSSDELSPAALSLGDALRRVGSPPTMALVSATTPALRREIAESLGLREPVVVEGRALGDHVALDLCDARGETRQRAIVTLALRLRRPGVIFAPTAHEVDAIYSALVALKLPVHRFHAHMPAGERVGEQLNFFVPGRRSIMVATSAFAVPSGIVGVGEAELLERAPESFGFGVEKRDIRFVIHVSPPPSLEQWVREVSLAGRDREEATAVLFHDASDRARNEMALHDARLAARHLRDLLGALEPLVAAGRPRTLEALALASGLPQRTTEALVGVLDDAGLVARASGWVKPCVDAKTLVARTERLASALDRSKAQAARRAEAMHAFTRTRGCVLRALEAHFGAELENACGRCGTCRGSLLEGIEPAAPAELPARQPRVQSFGLQASGGYGLALTETGHPLRAPRANWREAGRTR